MVVVNTELILSRLPCASSCAGFNFSTCGRGAARTNATLPTTNSSNATLAAALGAHVGVGVTGNSSASCSHTNASRAACGPDSDDADATGAETGSEEADVQAGAGADAAASHPCCNLSAADRARARAPLPPDIPILRVLSNVSHRILVPPPQLLPAPASLPPELAPFLISTAARRDAANFSAPTGALGLLLLLLLLLLPLLPLLLLPPLLPLLLLLLLLLLLPLLPLHDTSPTPYTLHPNL